jgi:thiosulfate dehydrogenase [quinone] large subunit
MMMTTLRLSALQHVSLVILRTLIGWHFLYEGYTKLLHPAWSQAGAPLPPWSSAGYLKAATGPFAPLFHWMAGASWIGSLDLAIAVGLTAVGISLMLGLFTQLGCGGALALLLAFYLAAVPTGGADVRAEGTYLLVNKTLVEAGAVLVLLACRTGTIAGVDLLRLRSGPATVGVQEAVV